jgi:hypothetical protein
MSNKPLTDEQIAEAAAAYEITPMMHGVRVTNLYTHYVVSCGKKEALKLAWDALQKLKLNHGWLHEADFMSNAEVFLQES